MSKDEDWIDERLIAAQKAHPLVTDGVVTRMKALIKGQISERQLSAKELVTIAQALLVDMAASDPTKVETSHED